MHDLIERKDVLDMLTASYVHEDGKHYWRDHNNDCIDRLIKKTIALPSSDAVEVVRCGECERCYYDDDEGLYRCTKSGMEHWMYYADNFCSFGKRKETENE